MNLNNWLKRLLVALVVTSGMVLTSCGGGGGGGDPPSTLRYVYVVNAPSTNASDTLAAYSSSQDTGQITTFLGTIPTGHIPTGVVVSPNGSYVYVVNSRDNSITQYVINKVSGSLLTKTATLVIATPDPKVPNAVSIAISPNGNYAYVVNYTTASIWQFSINKKDGTLTVTPETTPISTGAANSRPDGVVLSPDGNNLYVADYAVGSISRYTIDASTGVPTLASTFAIGGTPSGIVFSSDGKYAFVTDYASNKISQYSVIMSGDMSGDILTTPVVSLETSNRPNGLAISQDGKYVYVINSGSGVEGLVNQYSIISGVLTKLIGPVNIGTGTIPTGIAL